MPTYSSGSWIDARSGNPFGDTFDWMGTSPGSPKKSKSEFEILTEENIQLRKDLENLQYHMDCLFKEFQDLRTALDSKKKV